MVIVPSPWACVVMVARITSEWYLRAFLSWAPGESSLADFTTM